MSPKTATNNRIKLAKTTNQSKPATVPNSPKALSVPSSSSSSSSSSVLPLSPSSPSSLPLPSLVSAKELTVKEVATSEAAACELISSTTSMSKPKKIDPYSILSFDSASSTSSVSMAPMSILKEGIMSYQSVIAMLTLLFLFCGLASVDGLKCHMCGQYNEGVGSITPCLNYSEQYAHLYLKDCPKSTEKFCVKYVSELSTVRDCATECAEKEIWETKTYCCNTDGCNGTGNPEVSIPLLLMPVFYMIYRDVKSTMQTQH